MLYICIIRKTMEVLPIYRLSMKMKKFEVWTEGYAATGESGKATFHGEFKGETLKDAVIKWRNTLTDPHSVKCVDLDRMTFWGCRFFDNETDARKSFG